MIGPTMIEILAAIDASGNEGRHAARGAVERLFAEHQALRAGSAQDLVEHACEVMHDAYERAAGSAGWETNPASRKPWADVPDSNKTTMRAAVAALLEALQLEADPLKVVVDFVAKREEYVQALKNSPHADADYFRWSGHAEARRQLREKLEEAGVVL